MSAFRFRSAAGPFLMLLATTAVSSRPEAASPARAKAFVKAAPSSSSARPPLVMFLGDSLTAGHGLKESESFPARIEELLASQGKAIRVVNAGVSGDTSAGGLRRLDWLLRQKPAVLVVALGANDGLRGFPVEQIRENLRRILRKSRASGASVLLCGMLVPPNYGEDYSRRFGDIFPRLAKEERVPLVPFLLAGVAGDPKLNNDDGLHPNAEGQRRVAALVLAHLEPLLTPKRN